MGGSKIRSGLYGGGALAAVLLTASIALAQEVGGQVDFTDNQAGPANVQGPTLDLSVRDDAAPRFEAITPMVRSGEIQGPRRLELELAAGGGDAPLDVSIAQRASIGSDSNGDLNRRGSGQELRVGRGLVRNRDEEGNGEPSVYMFVASEDEALTWEPGARSEFGGEGSSLALQQERVEIGDMSAGVTYERNGIQASLAYVEREQSARVGGRTVSQDQAFTGVTVTMRH
jgi:hypothetical protein